MVGGGAVGVGAGRSVVGGEVVVLAGVVVGVGASPFGGVDDVVVEAPAAPGTVVVDEVDDVVVDGSTTRLGGARRLPGNFETETNSPT